MDLTASTVLSVRFLTGRTYSHAVAGDREAQNTIEGWRNAGGLWVVDADTRVRLYCPWHTVTEVVLPRPPHAGVVGGRGPAVRGAKPAAQPTQPQGGSS